VYDSTARPQTAAPVLPSHGARVLNLPERIRLRLAVISARIMALLIARLHLGAGSVLPGETALRIQPDLLPLLCRQAQRGVILIAGTNGKTTTALLTRTILEQKGYRIAHNITGANLENGLVSALLSRCNLAGTLTADYIIFEVDENVLPNLLRRFTPQLLVCLNLFRDQLDRYGEVDSVAARWTKAIAQLPRDVTVVVNADDPTLSYLGQQLPQRVLYFGLNEPESLSSEMPHAADSVYCPQCGQRLEYRGYYLSHLGDYRCPNCGFARSTPSLDSHAWPQALIGLYNKYNTLAAVLVAQVEGVDDATIADAVQHVHAAFGRAEELEVRGKQMRILLSKNPAGMNETIRVVQNEHAAGRCSTALVVLNDRTADGTDVSWIWDVDTEKLIAPGMSVIVSGDRAYDMALRIRYSAPTLDATCELIVKPDLRAALDEAIERTRDEERLHILPTYTAMLDVRQLLVGKQIL
jgi:UDP-N-acetylmuramyl tripeptide synthase